MTQPNENRTADQVSAVGSSGQEGHPDPEKIDAYRAGECSPDEREAIQDHLTSCRECTDLLLLRTDEPLPDNAGVLDFEKELIWARLKVDRADEAAKRQVEANSRKTRRERLGIAAAALVVLLPLGGLNLRQHGLIGELEQQQEVLTRPQLNVSIHDVLEGDPTTKGSATRDIESGKSMIFEIPSNTEFYTVVFPVGAPKKEIYLVELLDSEERLIWNGRGLEVDEYGYATLGLSRRFLDEGHYRLRVLGHSGEKEPIGDFPITIRYL